MKYHTSKTRRQAIELYTSTLMSTRAVAKAVCVNHQTVYEWMRDEGVIRTKNGTRQKPEAVRRRVVSMYLDKMSTREIAEATRLSPTTVKRWLKKAGVIRSVSAGTRIHAPRRYKWKDVKRVGELREKGVYYREISRLTGVPMGSVRSLHKRFLRELVRDLGPLYRRRPSEGITVHRLLLTTRN